MTTTASPQRWSAPDACRLAAFACMAACVAAQSSKGHGGVEDAQGRRLEGATTPGDNAPIRTHHVDLIFKTLFSQNVPMMMACVLTVVMVAFAGCVMWDIGDSTAKRLNKKKKTKTYGGDKDASL